MRWNIKASEKFISGDFVEFTADSDGILGCKKALELMSIKAVAARDIAEGEMLIFVSDNDTNDLMSPKLEISRH